MLRPVEHFLGNRSLIGSLRALFLAHEGLTGRQVAGLGGLSVQASHNALAELERMGIVRWRSVGRAQLYTLNLEHLYVREILQPLFESERRCAEAIRKSLAELPGKDAISVTLFGSRARSQFEPGSDYDLCVVVKGADQKEPMRSRLSDGAEIFDREMDGHLSPLVLSQEDIQRYEGTRNPLIHSLLEEGVTLRGKSIQELIHEI